MTSFTVEWIDWDYTLHKTTYRPSKNTFLSWSDKRQIRASQRGKVRQILQRYKK